MKLLQDLFKLTEEEDKKDDVESDAAPDINPEEDEPVDNTSADRPEVDEVDPEAPVEEPVEEPADDAELEVPHDEANVDPTTDDDKSGTADADEAPVEDVGSVAAAEGFVKSKKDMYAFGKTRAVTLLTKNEALGGLNLTYQYVINPQTGAWKLTACLEGQSEQDMVEFFAGEDPSSLIANLKKKNKITAHQAVDKLKPPADSVVKDKEVSDDEPEAVDEAVKDNPAVAKWKEKQLDNGASRFKKDKFNTGNLYLVALTTKGMEVARIRLDKLIKESGSLDAIYQHLVELLHDLADENKKHEAHTDSTPSAPDTSKFRATRSGMIKVERNVHTGGGAYSASITYPYFLKIGSNVKKDVRDAIHKEFASEFKHQTGKNFPGHFETPEGTISAGHVDGTNWGGIGLSISKKQPTKESDDLNKANETVHPVEKEWHYPIMTKAGFKPKQTSAVGLVRHYDYENAKGHKIKVATGAHGDWWEDHATGKGGWWAGLESHVKSLKEGTDDINEIKAKIWDLDRAIMTLEKGGKGMHRGRVDAMKLRNDRDELKDKLKELKDLKEAFLVEGAHDFGRSFPVDKFPTVDSVAKHIRAGAGHSSDPYSDENQLSHVQLSRVHLNEPDEDKLYDKMLDKHQKWDPLLIDQYKKGDKVFWMVAGWLAE